MKGNGDLGLDALLGRWPAEDPQKNGGPSWDERADAIVAAAVALKKEGSADVIEALLAPPPLAAEAGEEKVASQPMSDPPKKASLKELAARARNSIPPASASTPPPGRISSIPGGATVTPIHRAAAAKPARGSTPDKEDSGVLRLADLQAEVAKKDEAAAAAKAAEAAAAKEAKQVVAAPAPVIASAPVANNNSNKTGMWAGLAIAVLGVAAAFAVYRTRQPSTAPAKTDVVAVAPQAAQPTSNAALTAAPNMTAEPAAVASTEVAPQATAAAKGTDPAQGVGGQGPAAATAVAINEPKPTTSAAPKGDGKVGTLDEEMKKAVGPNESQPAPQDDSKPASGAASGSNLPDQPSQGNAQAAVRAVLPAAKACVAGATDPSMASITFGSSGSVQSVSVSGWAAANGKAGCVKSALQGAHVQPFARPTFTVPATIRP